MYSLQRKGSDYPQFFHHVGMINTCTFTDYKRGAKIQKANLNEFNKLVIKLGQE